MVEGGDRATELGLARRQGDAAYESRDDRRGARRGASSHLLLHFSLLPKLTEVRLQAELRTRSWLLRTRPAALQGRGVGLGLRSSSSPPSSLLADSEGSVSPFERGSREKWFALKKEEETGLTAAAATCDGTEWEEYRVMHEKASRVSSRAFERRLMLLPP
jgi:hypothetical protein